MHFFRISICEVWVMKEYGVASSWTVLYGVDPSFSNYQPLMFSHDGEEVLTGEILGQQYSRTQPHFSFSIGMT